MKFDSVTIPDRDVHEVKQRLKRALGGAPGLSELLERKGAENFDFWVAKDGTVWIGENGTGGREVETTVNFFTVFPAYAPPPDPTWQSNRPADWDPFAIPSDSESDSDN